MGSSAVCGCGISLSYSLFLQMEILGRQIFGKQQVKYFIDTFQRAASQKYRCLLVDISPLSDPTYKQKNQHLTMPVKDSVSVRKGNRNQLIKKEKYFLRLLITTTVKQIKTLLTAIEKPQLRVNVQIYNQMIRYSALPERDRND